MIASTVQEFGRLDVLHNNAALTESDFLSRDTGVTELSLEVWDRDHRRQPDAVRCSPASTPFQKW